MESDLKTPFDEELTVGLKHGKVDVTIATESSWSF